MDIRQTKYDRLPRIWLMTDPRIDEQLLKAVQRLPVGSGVVFRHYQLEAAGRQALFRQIARICRRRGHMLLLAGTELQARRWHADGFHGGRGRGSGEGSGRKKASARMVHSAPVHDVTEIRRAMRSDADLLFLSPLFATASHPGERPLGLMAFARLARLARGHAVIALGGISKRKALTLDARNIYGWAAIDSFRRK